jgi:transcriptional regulator with XRE-family HTH domain
MPTAVNFMMNWTHPDGKCQNHVPNARADGMSHRPDTDGPDLWFHPNCPCDSGRKRPPVPEVRSPTVRRRELGAMLRALRNRQGLTVEQVAERLLCSPSKVSRMETGQRGATLRDVRDLCDIYGVTDPAQREHMARLATEGKQQGWWQGFELDYFSTYVGLEEEATSLRSYQSGVIPGLLQTPAYTRAMHEIALPKLTNERIDRMIEVRLKRQQLLVRDPPLRVWAVLDEAALHRHVGGVTVMKDQLNRLVEVAMLPHVTIQVIPFSAGAHPAMESTFNILDFEPPAPSVVYVEGLIGFMYLERPQDISRYQVVFEHLGTQALTPRESIELISRTGVTYENTALPASSNTSNTRV